MVQSDAFISLTTPLADGEQKRVPLDETTDRGWKRGWQNAEVENETGAAHFDARIPVTSKEKKILESSRCLGSTKNSQNKCPLLATIRDPSPPPLIQCPEHKYPQN